MTSGAKLIIFINFLVLNSLVTGPKILVAIGSSCLSKSTAEFLSNLILVPSALLKSFFVLTMTALKTSPFLTLPLGIASLIETTIIYPIDANLL